MAKRWPKVRAPKRGLPLKDAFRAPSELTRLAGSGVKGAVSRKWLKK